MASKCNLFVKPSWLADKLKVLPDNFRLLDASWHMPHTQRVGSEEYLKQHIPSAQYFDIDVCADQNSEYTHMLPTVAHFEDYVGGLGIDNNTHVVIYDNNAALGMFSAQRVWWLFRTFGHDLVSMLEGGLPAWVKSGGDTTATVHNIDRKTFKAKFVPTIYKSFEDVASNLKTKEFTVLDARSPGRFNGTEKEPRAGVKPGHIPGSINLPFPKVLDPEKKVMKQPEELQAIFKEHGVDLNKPLVASCGSGVSGCMLVLAAYTCGKEDVALYDGSWTEWYLRAKPEQKEDVPEGDV